MAIGRGQMKSMGNEQGERSEIVKGSAFCATFKLKILYQYESIMSEVIVSKHSNVLSIFSIVLFNNRFVFAT
jgi:hypothetical protein